MNEQIRDGLRIVMYALVALVALALFWRIEPMRAAAGVTAVVFGVVGLLRIAQGLAPRSD